MTKGIVRLIQLLEIFPRVSDLKMIRVNDLKMIRVNDLKYLRVNDLKMSSR
jgi:hypothetical protein